MIKKSISNGKKRRRDSATHCCYCSTPFVDVKPTIDHFYPLCEGGANQAYNIVHACHRCNTLKGCTPPEMFFIKIKHQLNTYPGRGKYSLIPKETLTLIKENVKQLLTAGVGKPSTAEEVVELTYIDGVLQYPKDLDVFKTLLQRRRTSLI